MKDKIKSLFRSLHTWQIFLFSVIGAVLITDLVTALVSLRIWHEININLIVLGTINATLVPLIILPIITRSLRQVVKLEEQNRSHQAVILQLENQRQIESTLQRRAEEMSLFYRLGVSLTSGKNFYDTLLTLQFKIKKLIQADAFYVAIFDETTDLVKYPIFLDEGKPIKETTRFLHEWPGLTGAVIFSAQTLYLADMFDPKVEELYHPYDDHNLTLHTFLGIPLNVDGQVLGMLSVQSKLVDAYSSDQIQLIENVALQAEIAIDKANLLDQVKQELAERNHAEAQIREREAMLEATTYAAEQFLKTSDWRLNIDNVLERLGKTFHVTHAYLFEHYIDVAEVEYLTLKYEWTAAGYASHFDNPYYQNPNPIKLDEGSTDHSLRQGQIFVGNASISPVEKERLLALGVKAMVEVPLFVDEKWWGTFGLDDFENERDWSNAEVDALKIAAGVLSAAIRREKTESAVRVSETIYRQAIAAADAVPYYRDYVQNRYTFMRDGIEKIIGYKSKEVTPTLWRSIVLEDIPIGEA